MIGTALECVVVTIQQGRARASVAAIAVVAVANALILPFASCLTPENPPYAGASAHDDQALDKAALAEAQTLAAEGGLIDDTLDVTTTAEGAAAAALQIIIDRVVVNQFPWLGDTVIEARVGHSENSLLRTSFRPLDVARGPGHRRYAVIVSDRFTDAPDEAAIEALVIHELQHIYDYEHLTGLSLLEFVTIYLASPNGFVPRYERSTDVRALERAYATGRDTEAEDMVRYREFLYRVLPPALVQEKRTNYLQPAEIRACDAQIREAGVRTAPCLVTIGMSEA